MDMLMRKKALKIQERLGMRIGVMYGTKRKPVVRSFPDVFDALEELYRAGIKAFVLPPELFADITTASDLYKEHYGELLKVKELAGKYNIEFALHYSQLPETPDGTLKVFASLASIMNCRTFVIHPDFYSRIPQEQALTLVVHKLNEILRELRFPAKIGIETTGKVRQLGSLEDVIDIVKRTRDTEPIINWAHIHARGVGSLRTEGDYRRVIEQVKTTIGRSWLDNAYFFFSGISYGPSGEREHIPLARSDINLEHLVRQIMTYNIKGTLIFEDPDRERFVLKMLDQMAAMVR